jgi:O-antigen biosynthesis protein
MKNLKKKIKGILNIPDSNYTTHRVPELKRVLPFDSSLEHTRINIIIPSINEEHIYGGIYTALKFYDELSSFYEFRRIIITDFNPAHNRLSDFPGYTYTLSSDDSSSNLQIISLAGNSEQPLEVSRNDIFIATIWYTADLAQKLIRWQEEFFGYPNRVFIYFIQDYEPGFYPFSSQYVLAKNTYEHTASTIAIYNTNLLKQYFNNYLNIQFSYEYVFEPIMNVTLQHFLLKYGGSKKRKKILIYGRPSTPRNAFGLIIESLILWEQYYTRAAEWELFSAGESHEDIEIGTHAKLIALGKLSLDEYAKVLGESFIGLSLMLSPHPSYPPLEMSHFGMWVLTNSYENKDLSYFHENIISLSNLSPESISDKLISLCESYETSQHSGWLSQSRMNNYLTNNNLFDFLRDIQEILNQKFIH